ncbi:MAG: hypothetical protein JNM50_02650 [Chromatiales bacterium]|jgi:hypothetical protein|nr:hypothetical protein [Chromatiales bacterium]
MRRLPAVLAACLLAASPLVAGAQVNPAFADLDAAVSDARAVIQTERRMLVSDALQLSQSEAAAFWPLYDKYAAELKSIGDLRVKVITDYAAAYPDISDELANQLLKDGLKYQGDLVKLRKNYLKKFTKAIGPAKTARFYQVENKVDAIGSFALAREIPLFPGKKPALTPPGGR